MMNRFASRSVVASRFALVAAAALAGTASAQSVAEGYTAPSKKAEIALPILGVVSHVPVVEGQKVKKGDVLINQDDGYEQAQLVSALLQADVTATVARQQADFELKKLVYARKLSIFQQGGGNESEVQEAETDMKVSEASVAVEKQKGAVAEADVKAQRERIRLKTLLAPFDGVIERIEATEGEATDPQKPSLVIVQLDPLFVEIPGMQPEQVERMSLGQTVQVRYPGESAWMDAKVKYIAPVVDATADTQLVKLELPNPSNRYGGKRVEVKLPAPGTGRDAAAGNR
jgi:RND family efflux transporter MFP subunit